MRVLGVDPGLTRCGVAVIEGAAGRLLTPLHIGVIVTTPDLAIEDRLVHLEQELEKLVSRFEPVAIAIERVFAQQNLKSVMGRAFVKIALAEVLS